MRIFTAVALVLSILVLVVWSGTTASQSDTLDPLGCFVAATEESGLDQASAKQLCIGAHGPLTAGCFAEATGLGIFTQYQGVQLCYGASSAAPVRCAEQLRATSGLPTADIVDYCAATRWPFVSPPDPGSPECLAAAQELGIADSQAMRVCQGSTSAAPAECVRRGQELVVGLADADLVDLCSTVTPWPTWSSIGNSPPTADLPPG